MADSVIRGRQKESSAVFYRALKDSRLSLKTIGLFTVMQSFPDDWEYSVDNLAKHIGVGRDTIRKCLKELETAGYLHREQQYQENGKFGKSIYVFGGVK